MTLVSSIQRSELERRRTSAYTTPGTPSPAAISPHRRTTPEAHAAHVVSPSGYPPLTFSAACALSRSAVSVYNLYHTMPLAARDSNAVQLSRYTPSERSHERGKSRSVQKAAASSRHLHRILSGFVGSLRQHSERCVDDHAEKCQQTHPWLTLGRAQGMIQTSHRTRKERNEHPPH